MRPKLVESRVPRNCASAGPTASLQARSRCGFQRPQDAGRCPGRAWRTSPHVRPNSRTNDWIEPNKEPCLLAAIIAKFQGTQPRGSSYVVGQRKVPDLLGAKPRCGQKDSISA